jgi:hypothetical protein
LLQLKKKTDPVCGYAEHHDGLYLAALGFRNSASFHHQVEGKGEIRTLLRLLGIANLKHWTSDWGCLSVMDSHNFDRGSKQIRFEKPDNGQSPKIQQWPVFQPFRTDVNSYRGKRYLNKFT